MSSSNGALRIEALSHSYDPATSRRVLNDVSLEVGGGELVGLVGRSGEGKSTLLGLAGGLLAVQDGSVQVAGFELAGATMPERCRIRLHHIRMVFQEAGLLGGLTVLDNVCLPLEMGGMARSAALEASLLALRQVGLADCTSRRPSELSTGQRQRAGIARAMAGLDAESPRVVLVDEPTASLDRESSDEVLDALRCAGDSGMAVLVATHDPAVVAVMDRTASLSDGSLLLSHVDG